MSERFLSELQLARAQVAPEVWCQKSQETARKSRIVAAAGSQFPAAAVTSKLSISWPFLYLFCNSLLRRPQGTLLACVHVVFAQYCYAPPCKACRSSI